MAAILKSIKGHGAILEVLNSSLSKKSLASTHIFSGPSGIGKKLVAQAMAQKLLCEKGIEQACGLCGSCLRVLSKQSESMLYVEPEGQQIKIHQARSLLNFTHLRALRKSLVVIIDSVESMNAQAANALLKNLEEPGEGVYFFLICKSLGRLLPTIKSRSQVWHFKPLTSQEMKSFQEFPEWVLESAQGSLEMALQLTAEHPVELRAQAFTFWQKVMAKDKVLALKYGREIIKEKAQIPLVTRFWLQLLRDAMTFNINKSKLIHRDYMAIISEMSYLENSSILQLFKLTEEFAQSTYRNWDLNVAIDHYVHKSFEYAVEV